MEFKKNNIKRWSNSALNLYEQCPLKFYFERIVGAGEPITSPALERGNAIHAKAEQYLLGNIRGMPPELMKFKKEFENLKAANAIAEEEFVLDKYWRPITGPGKWVSQDAWLRAKVDARVGNYLIDFKTGKRYDKHEEQARLYSNILMCHDHTLDFSVVEFWYLDSGQVSEFEYSRDNLEDDIAEWDRRVAKMFKEHNWFPTENQYCRWCPHQDNCEVMK